MDHDADSAKYYPYRAADLERIKPSEVRVGDLIAGRGPVGSDVYVGKRVVYCGWAGYDEKFWKDDTYRVETTTPWGTACFVNPERMRVLRVREDARKDWQLR